MLDGSNLTTGTLVGAVVGTGLGFATGTNRITKKLPKLKQAYVGERFESELPRITKCYGNYRYRVLEASKQIIKKAQTDFDLNLAPQLLKKTRLKYCAMALVPGAILGAVITYALEKLNNEIQS